MSSAPSTWSLAKKNLPTTNTAGGPDDVCYTLVFFSTFEVLDLPIKGPMEDAGVVKLYELSPTPCLYVAPAQNMVGRVSLICLDARICSLSRVSFGLEPASDGSGRRTHLLRRDGPRSTTTPSTSTVTSGTERRPH